MNTFTIKDVASKYHISPDRARKLARKRGDWMLWLAGRLVGPPESESRKKLVLATCQCARLALPYVAPSENRPLRAIETAEKWARGQENIILSQVENAAYAAFDAFAAAAAAAFAAACAAIGAAFAARMSTLAKCAETVRQYYPTPPEVVK